MATKCGAGFSKATASATAGREAAQAAMQGLGGGADIVFVFCSTNHDYAQILQGVRGVTGKAPLIGCSTSGEFTHTDVGHGTVSVMAVRSDTMRFRTGFGRGLKANQRQAAADALKGFTQEHRAARAEGMTHATVFVCTDGLAGRGEDLVETIHAETGMLAQVVGGAAADDAKFVRTDVFFDDAAHTDALAVAYAFSRSPIGLGVRHGLNAGCDTMIVTKATDNLVKEIDGKPAIQAYEKFASARGERAEFDKGREGFMIVHELGMLTPTGEYKIRAPLKANDDGSLGMAAEVPTGAAVSIMEGTKGGLVAAAELAARSAMANLGGARPAGVLVFDCICRRIFLGDEYKRQVEAFRGVVGQDVPIVGWETYGEIAMTPSQQTGWHNSTTVLAILPR
ncbi:MAG TPA: FIST N-terminal domain-containing protein [Myxococcota bacterium]|jgi:methyl-accepting chemotaxis protein|nr:FIST N-terminal domain-containing protein [Myxococcota bacterium]